MKIKIQEVPKSYDSIFQSEEQRNTEEIKPVPISELKTFTEQPFKVKLDEDMDALVESIKQSGVLTPVIAIPHKGGGYEILSGHRRVTDFRQTLWLKSQYTTVSFTIFKIPRKIQ